MKMSRVKCAVAGGVAILMMGAIAQGQVTYVSAQRQLRALSPCAEGGTVSISTTLLGVFSDFAITANLEGLGRANQTSNLQAGSMTGSLYTQTVDCGVGTSRVNAVFSLDAPQRWHLKWNMPASSGPVVSINSIQSLDGSVVFSGASRDSVEILAAGTYEMTFEVTLSTVFGEYSSGGSFEITQLPFPSSRQVLFQSELLDGGVPFNGVVDARFTLFDAQVGGSQVGNAMLNLGIGVQDGLFAASLAPEPQVGASASLFAQIAVRTNGGSFIDIPGRKPLTTAPFALRAMNAVAADLAANALNASTADFAPAATNAVSATTATSASSADQALVADVAASADSVPFVGILNNPWTRSGTLLSTLNWVGIGKVPTDPLDVLGNIRINDQNLYLRGPGDINHGLGWYGTGKTFATLAPDGPVLFGYASGALGTKQGGERTALMWNALGQVGIGTTAPAGFTLAVNGFAAKPGGGSWATLSDPRAKKNITPMTGTLDRLMQLHGYEYTYRPEFVDAGFALPGRQIGLLASEVQQVFPDWIDTGSDGYLRVTERSTTALMVEALRDLTAEKERDLAELRQEVARLEALVQARKQRN